jgi:hypothetical protein
MGATFRHNIPYLMEMGKIRQFEQCGFLLIFQRTIVGLTFLVLQRFVSKGVIYVVIRSLHDLIAAFSAHSSSSSKKSNPKEFKLKEIVQGNYKLELIYYLFIYGSIGFGASLTCFCLFEYLNLV